MGAPYALWSVTSVLASVPLVLFAPKYSIAGSYAYTAAAFFFFQWFAFGIYWVILYPRFVSPLRGLPQPKVCMSPDNSIEPSC
jgi:hypothetical protein